MKSSNNHPLGKLKNMVAFDSPTVVVFFLSLFTILWGLWFLMPWEVFAVSHTFDLMGRMANEEVWGGVFVFFGLLKLWALWEYLTTDKVSKRQVIFSFILFTLWSTVTLSIGMENFRSTGIPTYGFVALVSIWTTAQRLNEYWFQRRTGAFNG